MENQNPETNQINISSSTIKQTKTQQKSHHHNAMAESLSPAGLKSTNSDYSSRKKQRRELIEKKKKKMVQNHQQYYEDDHEDKLVNNKIDDENGGDENKEEVERKIEALQRIVPGGESLGVDKLFEETAGYILSLQCQLKAMKALATFFEGLEKEKRKFGG